MNVNKRCIRWSFTLNQNTREKLHLSIFLPPVLSLEYLRTSTSFLETKKKNIFTMSVPKSMQRMVTVPRGRGMFAMMKIRNGVISGMLLVKV